MVSVRLFKNCASLIFQFTAVEILIALHCEQLKTTFAFYLLFFNFKGRQKTRNNYKILSEDRVLRISTVCFFMLFLMFLIQTQSFYLYNTLLQNFDDSITQIHILYFLHSLQLSQYTVNKVPETKYSYAQCQIGASSRFCLTRMIELLLRAPNYL